MPNRIIREGILTSDRVNSLSWEEEIFYRRLLSVVDDFGRFDARAAILRTSLYPLKIDQMRENSVQRCLNACETARLVVLYSVNDKPYLEVVDFKQQVRSKVSKYPSRDSHCATFGEQVNITCESNDKQMYSICIADDIHTNSKRLSHDEHMHTKTETETESYSETKAYSAPTPDVGEVLLIVRNVNTPPPANEQVQCAQSFIDEMEACGWLNKHGLPVTNWQAMARSFAGKWGLNSFKSSGKAIGSKNNRNTGTANEGRDYSL